MINQTNMKHTKTTSAERLSYQQTSVIQELVNCALACESCTSGSLQERHVAMMARCIELTRDCADICFQGSRLIMRNSHLADQFLKICEEACRVCAEECKKHDDEHCTICAEACESCANKCNEFQSA
jgi:hypothetical protein